MFRFDFQVQEENSEHPFSSTRTEYSSAENNKIDSIEWNESERILLEKKQLNNLDLYRLNATELTFGDVTVKYILSPLPVENTSNRSIDTKQDIEKAEKLHSDLLPGLYEGGAKIWECTEDLLKYLIEQSPKAWKGKRVLDLGCGSGLLGLFAYKSGAIVEFQDYNPDVLENITIPNLLLNVPLPPDEKELDIDNLNKELRFYSGDWAKYMDLTSISEENEKFDFILTSETIYNPKNQQKLLNTFDAKLKCTGSIYVAAKTYYFGVGGGLRQFEELINADNRFKSSVVWIASNGISREIILLKRL